MCFQEEILILSYSATAGSFIPSFIEKRHYERHSKMAAQQRGSDAGKLSLNVSIGLPVSSLPPLIEREPSLLMSSPRNTQLSLFDAKYVLEMSKCGVSQNQIQPVCLFSQQKSVTFYQAIQI